MSGYISTHVLNLASGRPGRNISVLLLRKTEDGVWETISRGVTDEDGRISRLFPPSPAVPAGSDVRSAGNSSSHDSGFTEGLYRLEFDLDGYFDEMGLDSFLPEAVIAFTVKSPAEHFHVPLLLSPNGFSTYRGS